MNVKKAEKLGVVPRLQDLKPRVFMQTPEVYSNILINYSLWFEQSRIQLLTMHFSGLSG